MKKQIRAFILGFLACAMLSGGAAYAATGSTSIEVVFEKLHYMFDGVEKQPAGAQGFIYEGTTYVPLRFMSEQLGKEVQWDSGTKTIWIGQKPAAPSPAASGVYLSDMELTKTEEARIFLSVDKWGTKPMNTTGHTSFTINGVTYSKGLAMYHHDNAYPPDKKTGGNVTIQLDQKYTKLTGIVGADHSTLKDTASGTVTVYGDDAVLQTYGGIKADQDGTPVELDVTGVKVLKINFNSNRQGLLNLIFADAKVQ